MDPTSACDPLARLQIPTRYSGSSEGQLWFRRGARDALLGHTVGRMGRFAWYSLSQHRTYAAFDAYNVGFRTGLVKQA